MSETLILLKNFYNSFLFSNSKILFFNFKLLRLAYRFNHSTECIYLTNGTIVNESAITKQTAFGASYGRLFFKFCRQFSQFNLNKIEFALLCALKFFANDRPLLIERNKVQQIQTKYIELLEYFLEQNQSIHQTNATTSNTLNLAHILLSLVKLRAIDILTAERMLNIVTLNEKTNAQLNNNNNTVEGYITEVLHREYLNVTADLEIDSENENDLSNNKKNTISNVNMTSFANISNNFKLNTFTPTKPGVTHQQLPLQQQFQQQPKAPTTPNMKPQVIKLQPFLQSNSTLVNGVGISQSSTTYQQINTANNLSPHKPIIYVSQSPIKSNKLIKINSNALPTNPPPINSTASLNLSNFSEIKTEPQTIFHNQVEQQNLSQNNFLIQSQQQQMQQQQQPPQVLNLVLVTDSVNGAVSYLLAP